jgi:hypothetical protein
METRIMVKRELKLINIFVDYQSPKKYSEEYPTTKEFNASLHTQPLLSIDSIYIPGELEGVCQLNFVIRHGDSPDKWIVEKENQFFFDFTYNNEGIFMDVFWEQLKKRLDPPDPPGHEAKFSMNGN